MFASLMTVAVPALLIALAAPACQHPSPHNEARKSAPSLQAARKSAAEPAQAGMKPAQASAAQAAMKPARKSAAEPAQAGMKPAQASEKPAIPYLKGSTHVHTVHSGDSSTSVADVVRWYTEHDYDFIVITDHNRVISPGSDAQTLRNEEERERPPERRYDDLLVIPGVELTHNPGRCEPAPPAPNGRCRIHVNSLFVDPASEVRLAARMGREPGARMNWRERKSRLRVDMYQRAFERSVELGGMAQINHPTWHWGVDGALLTELGRRGAVLVEIANQAFERWNQGSESYPSTEAIWDEALAAGVTIWGVASDDAHHYYNAAALQRRAASGRGGPVYPAGTGFVMVRAERDPAAIRKALEQGEFYGSTGVLLDTVERGAQRPGTLRVVVASPGDHEITFIGTRAGQGGQRLHSVRGRQASYTLTEPGYVRVVVSDAQGRKAWGQPLFVR